VDSCAISTGSDGGKLVTEDGGALLREVFRLLDFGSVEPGIKAKRRERRKVKKNSNH
jgi:hypothetical protein